MADNEKQPSNVETFVDKLASGDNTGAGDAFKDAMRDKVGDALDTGRKEYASNLFNAARDVMTGQTQTPSDGATEVAVDTAESSIETLQADALKSAELTKKLQKDLQKAEAYGDNLRNRLRELDLVQDAIRDSANLEGRMNGATAKLWRELEAATGGDGNTPLPNWLLVVPRTGSESSNTDREDNSTNGSSTKPN